MLDDKRGYPANEIDGRLLHHQMSVEAASGDIA